ncbi:MAG: AsmA family protein [Desulfovibrionaceae bacterium]
MRIIKLLFKLALVLALLCVIAAVGVILFLDPNEYRDRIAQLVQEQTGRELVLAGPLKLSVFPSLALEAEDVTLGNAQGFGDAPMAQVRRASLDIRLLPLLQGRVRIGHVDMDGLELRLMRDAQGRTNWEDLDQPATEGSPATERPGNETPGRESSAAYDFALQGVSATNVHLVWDDRSADTHYELNDAQLRMGAVRLGAPVTLELSFGFTSDKPQVAATLRLAGDLGYDISSQQYAMPRLDLHVQAQGKGLPGGQVEFGLAADNVLLDLDRQTLGISGFTLRGHGAEANGSLTVRDLLKAPSAEGVVELSPCDLRAVCGSLGLKLPETADPNAFTSVATTAKFRYSPELLEIPFLELDADGDKVRGSLRIENFNAPVYAVDLETADLNVDRYLAPTEKGTDVVEQPFAEAEVPVAGVGLQEGQGQIQAAELEQTLEPLRHLNMDVGLRADKLKAGGLRFQDVQVRLRARNGVLALEPLRLGLKHEDSNYALETGKAFGDLYKMALRVDSFRLTGPSGNLSGRFSGTNLLDAPDVEGSLAMERLNVRELANVLKLTLPEMADPMALSDVQGTFAFAYAPQGIAVPDFDLRLDGAPIKGFFRRSAAEPAAYRFALKAGRLDLDRYLPPVKEGASSVPSVPEPGVQAGAKPGDKGGKSEGERTDLLAEARKLDAQGTVDVDVIKFRNVELKGIHAETRAAGGVVDLAPLSFTYGEGAVDLAWRFDARTKTGTNMLAAKIRSLKLGPPLRSFAGIKDFEGTLTMRTLEPLTWQGLDVAGLKRSLSGQASFAVRDGVYPGLDIFSMIAVVDQITSVLEGKKDDRTRFGEATGTLVAKNGVVHCDNLCVKGPGLRASGEGFVNLSSEEIDYLVRAMAVPDSQGQGGAACDEFYGVPIPVRVSGTFDKPRYWVSGPEYAASVARGVVGLVSGVVGTGTDAVGTVVQGGADAAGGVVQKSAEAVGDVIESGAEAVEKFIDELGKLF